MIPRPLAAAIIPPRTELKERKFSFNSTHLLLFYKIGKLKVVVFPPTDRKKFLFITVFWRI